MYDAHTTAAMNRSSNSKQDSVSMVSMSFFGDQSTHPYHIENQ